MHSQLTFPFSCMDNPVNNSLDLVDRNEAPLGFYAVAKEYKGYNICRDCDARKLCQQNKDNWCNLNRCMSTEITDQNGITYKRKDRQSVIFKSLTL